MKKVNLKKYNAPHLQRIYEQGMEDGIGIVSKNLYKHLEERFNTLSEIHGVGEKTAKKIMDHLMIGINA